MRGTERADGLPWHPPAQDALCCPRAPPSVPPTCLLLRAVLLTHGLPALDSGMASNPGPRAWHAAGAVKTSITRTDRRTELLTAAGPPWAPRPRSSEAGLGHGEGHLLSPAPGTLRWVRVSCLLGPEPRGRHQGLLPGQACQACLLVKLPGGHLGHSEQVTAPRPELAAMGGGRAGCFCRRLPSGIALRTPWPWRPTSATRVPSSHLVYPRLGQACGLCIPVQIPGLRWSHGVQPGGSQVTWGP